MLCIHSGTVLQQQPSTFQLAAAYSSAQRPALILLLREFHAAQVKRARTNIRTGYRAYLSAAQ